MTLPTRAEFDRARSTPRAYVVVDARGLRWELRPVLVPPRPRKGVECDHARLEWLALAQLHAEPEPEPTLRRFDSDAIARRMIAEARAEWREWVRRG